ncbi:unnamed protein product, partial [marine sediment metagenome]
MELKYGKGSVSLPLEGKNVIRILHSKEKEVLSNPEHKLKRLLKNPIDSLSLRELILQKKAQNILVI